MAEGVAVIRVGGAPGDAVHANRTAADEAAPVTADWAALVQIPDTIGRPLGRHSAMRAAEISRLFCFGSERASDAVASLPDPISALSVSTHVTRFTPDELLLFAGFKRPSLLLAYNERDAIAGNDAFASDDRIAATTRRPKAEPDHQTQGLSTFPH
jgi:hypothetical protein